MKTTICFVMLAVASLSFSGCVDNEPRHEHEHEHASVTTSETTEIHRPVSRQTTVETQQVRQY